MFDNTRQDGKSKHVHTETLLHENFKLKSEASAEEERKARKGNVVEQIVEQVWIGQQEERELRTPKCNIYKRSDLIRAFCG
jgi:hypothetical protein